MIGHNFQLGIGTDIFGCCKVKKYKHKNYIRLNMEQMLQDAEKKKKKRDYDQDEEGRENVEQR